MIPLGSLTADHEMVRGVGKLAPDAGESKAGAGTAATADVTAASNRITTDTRITAGWIFIDAYLQSFIREGGTSSGQESIQPNYPD